MSVVTPEVRFNTTKDSRIQGMSRTKVRRCMWGWLNLEKPRFYGAHMTHLYPCRASLFDRINLERKERPGAQLNPQISHFGPGV